MVEKLEQTLGDAGIARVRTLVPIIVGFVLTMLARVGIGAEWGPYVTVLISTALSSGWYLGASWLERKRPDLAAMLRLLILTKTPSYGPDVAVPRFVAPQGRSMSFGEALEALHAGQQVTRTGWYGQHRLGLQRPDAHSKMTEPYIFITTQDGKVVPWLASQADVLAADWETVSQPQ